jgi:group II intron reverse transcriptase/maturase
MFEKRMAPEAVEGPIRQTRVIWRRLNCLNPRVHTVKTSGRVERLQPRLSFECWRQGIGSGNDIVEGLGGNESPQGPEQGAYITLTNVHHDRKAGSPTGHEPYGDGDPIVVAGVTPRHGEWESHSQGKVGQVQADFRHGKGCEMQNTLKLLGIYRERGHRGLRLERVYRQLFNEELYLQSYGKLYRNEGAMTPGATPETPDGMTLAKIHQIIAALRAERYQWTPARRTQIPKKKGGTRPLGLPTWSDKLLQDVLRTLLETYYEPQFRESSHGFRPDRGCHTALSRIHQWKAVTWFIEGDIAKCFERIDHDILLKLLGERIDDGRFLQLVGGLLQAGYLEDWRFHRTHSGTPQGGVISPLLSNIYLDRLDAFVEDDLIPQYTRGEERRRNPAHRALVNAAYKAKKKGDWERWGRIRTELRTLPSMDPEDPDFRRLKYVRYADDFLLGFIGPQCEAEAIKSRIREFLADQLKLELSNAKTLITHGRTEAARFLGYEVVVSHNDNKLTAGRRSANGQVALLVPRDVTATKRQQFMRRGRAFHRSEMINESDYSIIARYQSHWRGFLNYCLMAKNVSKRLKPVFHTMRTSLLRTLAAKHRAPAARMADQFTATVEDDRGRHPVLQVTVRRPGKKELVATFGGLPIRWQKEVNACDPPNIMTWCRRTELVERLLADKCELCGCTTNCEVHHIRKLADVHRHGRPQLPWQRVMIARRRKTLVLCAQCHRDIHHGTYDGPSIRSALESRVQ